MRGLALAAMGGLVHLLRRIQAVLDFEDARSPHFVHENGIGRHGVAGLFLGSVCGFHFCATLALVALYSGSERVALLQWCSYVCLLCVFHALEWLVTAVRRPRELGPTPRRSWLARQNSGEAPEACSAPSLLENLGVSDPNVTCVMLCRIEYAVLPSAWSLKGNVPTALLGLVASVVALRIRVDAMWTCGKNFDHQVMVDARREDHELVTDGIYRWLRHPSYFGWFYWSIAGQLLLGNPICFVAFALVSMDFFQSRVPLEEEALLKFYNDRYVDYASQTPIGIPFVEGAVPFVGQRRRRELAEAKQE
eukprot:scaffold2224_cov261-Pinguiococcus_pyrenoidosus.AAC.45